MKLFSLVPSAIILAGVLAAQNIMPAAIGSNELIRCPDFASVYYVGADAKRYVFVNDKAFFTWYADFRAVRLVTCAELAALTIGGNVTYRPGARMVKIQSDPKVYAVARGGVLRPIATEAVAAALYGPTWNQQIDDIPDSFFVNYTIGTPISAASEYSRSSEQSTSPSINEDKRLAQIIAGQTEVSLTSDGRFSPQTVSVEMGARVRWTNNDDAAHRVSSDPHPTHTNLPGFDSLENIPPGFTYSYTFQERGTFTYHDHLNPTATGTVIVR